MDELEISGRRYISSARAAKEHKYHSDYIGQLVRGGKVVGQKVGRAWYVDADSLAEYLGKEVTPRSPLTNKPAVVTEVDPVVGQTLTKVESVGSEEESVAEPTIDVRDSSSDLEIESTHLHETPFMMPLRKSGRSHVVASIEDERLQRAVDKVTNKAKEESNVDIQKVEPVEEEKVIAEPATASAPDNTEEEETFIPVKITSEATHNIYAEPEDSFYKVSRTGLRYVSPLSPAVQKVFAEGKGHAAPRVQDAVHAPKRTNVVAKSLSAVLVAGILSLGVGVLMSYYLHSITSVVEAGQTSSVILSN